MSQQTRHYLHRIITALIAILIAAGLIGPDAAEQWVYLAAAVLAIPSTATADVYSNPKKVDVTTKPGA